MIKYFNYCFYFFIFIHFVYNTLSIQVPLIYFPSKVKNTPAPFNFPFLNDPVYLSALVKTNYP